MSTLDDNMIVELYLMRDENALKESAKKYGNRFSGSVFDAG